MAAPNSRASVDASVAVVGCGGLGAATASLLAESGVRHLVLFDDDSVSLSNLHRQLLYRAEDLGSPKADLAAQKLRLRFPATEILVRPTRITEGNARADLAGIDVIVDGTDSTDAKYLLNRTAIDLRTPLIHAGVTGLRAQILSIVPRSSACLECVFPRGDAGDDAGCQTAGVVGPLPSLVAAVQVYDALRLLRGQRPAAVDRLLTYDARRGRWHTTGVARQSDCPACGDSPSAHFR